jgi:hypothetical protein
MNFRNLSSLAAMILLSATPLNSQSTPATKSPAELLNQLKATNALLLEKQQKTLQTLDALSKEADQIKAFSKRG